MLSVSKCLGPFRLMLRMRNFGGKGEDGKEGEERGRNSTHCERICVYWEKMGGDGSIYLNR